MRDVMSLVREVRPSVDIIKDKSNAYKKAQSYLKSALKELVPQEGKSRCNLSVYV